MVAIRALALENQVTIPIYTEELDEIVLAA
jgi:hypothetical protein